MVDFGCVVVAERPTSQTNIGYIMQTFYIVDQNALHIGGHYFSYTSSIAQAAVEFGYKVVILENIRNQAVWDIDGANIIPTFSKTWNEAEEEGTVAWGPGNIAYEFSTALDVPPGRDDHILFFTISSVELRMLLDYIFQINTLDRTPTFHIMLRYNPEDFKWRFPDSDRYFKRIKNSPYLSRIVKFYTDTEYLSRIYSAYNQIPFSTLPIPFRQNSLHFHLAQPQRTDNLLKVAYLGDARLEKNFHWIPDAIEAVLHEPRLAQRVQFTLQCNFNSEGGELYQLAAKQRLAHFPSRTVQLFDRPLDSEEYYGLLADADVVLIPYSSVDYKARSSGVFVEAMAAGKPVITTRGSWMASMMAPGGGAVIGRRQEFGPALVDVLLTIEHASAAAQTRAQHMLEWSSGRNFIREFSQHVALAHAESDRPHIFTVMDGGAMILRNGASQVARAQFSYLNAAGYRITALFLVRNFKSDLGSIETYVEQLKDAIADLDIDAWFIAAPGRLSLDVMGQHSAQSRRPETIASDLDRSRRYDYPAELLLHLRHAPPDAVLLNYVTNFGVLETLGLTQLPVLCEMHDIQSFQKAIYGGRAVLEKDLALEFALLTRCAHLISLNENETAFARERLPHMPITTTGIFASSAPLSLAMLAGYRNLAELIAACGPERDDVLSGAAWRAPTADGTEAIDLFYVSSNHMANVSGLKWFLDHVYFPLLEPLGVSMVVAGSIADVGSWPVADRLVFVGRVQDLMPLYAAARVTVLPVIEGAGAAVKSFEAMRLGRPVVATSLAMRGLATIPEGVKVTDDPDEMGSAILDLLNDAPRRAARGAQIARTAQALIDPNRYRIIMDGIFQTLLKERSRSSKPFPDPVAATAIYPEWNATLQSVNGIIRDLMSGASLDPADLHRLRSVDPQAVRLTAENILKALYLDRTASILQNHKQVSRYTRKDFTIDAADIDAAVDLIGAVVSQPVPLDQLDRASSCRVSVSFYSRSGWDGSCTLLGGTGGTLSLGGRTTAEAPLEQGWRSTLLEIPAAADSILPFRTLTVTADLAAPDPQLGFVLQQRLSLSDLLGTEPAAMRNPSRFVAIKTSGSISLAVPRIFSSCESRLFLDLDLRGNIGSAVIVASIDGMIIPFDIVARPSSTRARVEIPNRNSDSRFDPLGLDVSVLDAGSCLPGIVISGAVLSLVVADNASSALSVVNRDDILAQTPEALGSYLSSSLASVVREMAAGRTPDAGIVSLLRIYVQQAPDWLDTALAWLLAQGGGREVGRPEAAAAVLRALLYPERAISIASPALPMAITASFDDRIDLSGVSCWLGTVQAERCGGSLMWMRPKTTLFTLSDWLFEPVFLGTDGQTITPSSYSASIQLLGVADNDGAREIIKTHGLYDPELENGRFTHCWSGPEEDAVFIVPAMAAGGAHILFDIVNFGANTDPGDIQIFLNEMPVETRMDYTDGVNWIVATAAAGDLRGTSLRCTIRARRVLPQSAGDLRVLRLAIRAGYVRLPSPPSA